MTSIRRSPFKKLAVGAVMALVFALPGVLGSPAGAQSSCPQTQVFVVAGTYAFDHYRSTHRQHPAIPENFIPGGMGVPLDGLSARTAGRVTFHTVDYPAQPSTFWNWLGIFQSAQAGRDNTKADIASFASRCPGSAIALYGYSQGAWVAGDVATDIANGNGPVPSVKLAVSYLQADPVQTPGRGTFIGPQVAGTGVLPARYAGFGNRNATTYEFCAVGDKWCDNSIGLPQVLDATVNNPAHGSYDTYQVFPGLPATLLIAWHMQGLAH